MKTLSLPESEIITLASAAQIAALQNPARTQSTDSRDRRQDQCLALHRHPEAGEAPGKSDKSDEVRTACRLAQSGVFGNRSDRALQSDPRRTAAECHHRIGRILHMWRLTYYMAGIISGMLGGAALIIVIHG